MCAAKSNVEVDAKSRPSADATSAITAGALEPRENIARTVTQAQQMAENPPSLRFRRIPAGQHRLRRQTDVVQAATRLTTRDVRLARAVELAGAQGNRRVSLMVRDPLRRQAPARASWRLHELDRVATRR